MKFPLPTLQAVHKPLPITNLAAGLEFLSEHSASFEISLPWQIDY